MTLRWAKEQGGGRLLLPRGDALLVKAHGGEVRFSRGALELTAIFPREGDTEGALLAIEHPFLALEHVFIPHLTPDDGNVIGDFVFRSPAVILADRTQAIALIPDLDDTGAAEGFRVWLDYDHPRRHIELGAGAYRVEGHTFFVKDKVACQGQRVRVRLHVLASRRAADCSNPYGMVARWLWKRWGRPGYERGASRGAPLPRAMEHVVRWAFSSEGWGDEVWQSFELQGEPAGAPVFIVDVTRHPKVPPLERRWREPRSIWNQAWFSTQRAANGLYRYARQVGSADLLRRAHLMTEVALSAPERDGLFPSVLLCAPPDGWEKARWTNSDRRPPSASEEACHIVDAAFTCRMLLEWHALTGEERARERVRAFADRLARLQRLSGAFPGWVEPDGSVPEELAESAETAVGVTLLFELLEADGAWEKGYDPAMRGVRFLEGVIAEGRWEDFETYYSCAPWGAKDMIGRRVPRNGVYKQNTLSIFWCAEAMLRAWRAGGDRRHLRLARRCIDELSLFQAVWDPPFLTAPAHGGFGVMNGDCEWNDARQSLFAPLYLELAQITGDEELLERGVSALRASFSMLYCPENEALARAYEQRFPLFGPESYGFMMENQGHSGRAELGDFCIFTWGNGSALATAAWARDRFGEVFARVEGKE